MLIKTGFILFLVYFTAIEGTYEREGYPDYKFHEFHEDLYGWTKLHEAPADWDAAMANCQKEGAVVASSWTNELHNHINEITKNAINRIDVLYVGAQTLLHPVALCNVIYPGNGTSGRVECTEKHPYICFALAPKIDCDVHPLGQDRKGWPGYNRCSKVKGWLKLHPGPADRDEAKLQCEKEGAVLINAFNGEFKKQADKMINANITAGQKIVAIHTGQKLTFPAGGFVEENGKLVYKVKLGHHCVVFLPNGTESRTECSVKLAFICYAPFTPYTEYTCGDGNYTYDKRSGRCYKIYSVGNTWNDARKHCQRDGGDLTVLNSPLEAKLLREMIQKHLAVYYAFHPHELSVGIHEKSPGVWRTITGTTLEHAGYNEWAEGKPSFIQVDEPDYLKGARQTCGAINREGKLVNCWCELNHGYVCEKVATVLPQLGRYDLQLAYPDGIFLSYWSPEMYD